MRENAISVWQIVNSFFVTTSSTLSKLRTADLEDIALAYT